jgi:16S rRNA processing protein RimM
VKVEPLSDFPERFERGSRLWLAGVERTVERGRWQGRSVILKLQDVDSRNDAEALRGEDLTVPEAAELEGEGVFYLHDVIGLRVEDRDGVLLGTLAEVLTTGANDVDVVRGDRGELLLPALDDIVQVDLPGKRIVADVPEGLEFSRPASAPPPNRRRRRPA